MNTNKPILISLHGGCFVGGSIDYDKKQNKSLSRWFNVYAIDFPKDNFTDTIEYISNYITNLYNRTQQKMYILGRSSGGYLAKVIFDKFKDNMIESAIYVAPVFDPQLRGKLHKKFGALQKYYFRHIRKYPSTKSFDTNKELLLLVQHDKNVPKECFTDEQLKCAIILNESSHHELLKTTSNEFHDVIDGFVNKN